MVKKYHIVQFVLVLTLIGFMGSLYLILDGSLQDVSSSFYEAYSGYTESVDNQDEPEDIMSHQIEFVPYLMEFIANIGVIILLIGAIVLNLLLLEIIRIEGDEYNLDEKIF